MEADQKAQNEAQALDVYSVNARANLIILLLRYWLGSTNYGLAAQGIWAAPGPI